MIKRSSNHSLKHFTVVENIIAGLPFVALLLFLLEVFLQSSRTGVTLELLYKMGWAATRWFAIGWASFRLLICLTIILTTKRAFKTSVSRQRMLRASKALRKFTKTDSFVFAGKSMYYLGAIVVALVYWLLKNANVLILLIPIGMDLVWIRVRMTQPPGLLFLSSSRNKMAAINHYDFKMHIAPYRVVSLLVYNQSDSNKGYEKLYDSTQLDCFRTEFDEDWKTVIFGSEHQQCCGDSLNDNARERMSGLIENVKLVVMDTEFVTQHTIEEATHLVQNHYSYKTIFLGDYRNECSLLNKVIEGTDKNTSMFCVADHNSLLQYLKVVFLGSNFPSEQMTVKEIGENYIEAGQVDVGSATADQLVSRGNQLLSDKKYREAEECYLRALHSTTRSHGSIWTNLAIISLNERDHGEAAARIEKALTLSPDHSNALYTAGLIFEASGKIEQAIGYYERFLSSPGSSATTIGHNATLHLNSLYRSNANRQ